MYFHTYFRYFFIGMTLLTYVNTQNAMEQPVDQRSVWRSLGTRVRIFFEDCLMQSAINGFSIPTKLLLCIPFLDINHSRSLYNRTALVWAAYNGHAKTVQALMNDQRLRINTHEDRFFSPLVCASWNGHTQTVQALLTSPLIEIDLLPAHLDAFPLILAASSGHDHTVAVLLEDERVTLNGVNGRGETALLAAVYQGRASTIQMLLTYPDIQVNHRDKSGETALLRATLMGWPHIVALLLKHPTIEVNLTDSKGDTALMRAARAGYREIVCLLLATKESDITIQNHARKTALMLAKEQSVIKNRSKRKDDLEAIIRLLQEYEDAAEIMVKPAVHEIT